MKKYSLTRSAYFLFLLSYALSIPSCLRAQATAQLAIMPLPAHAVVGEGQFPINGNFGIALDGYTEPRLVRAQQRFLDVLSRETGIPLYWRAQYNHASFTIHTAGPSDAVQQLGEDESYRLEISPTQVQLTAANPLGVLHGLQTFLQLVRVTPQGFSVPAVTIDDKPRFPWRGLMIDTSRHFVTIPTIKRDLDGMEAVKLNVFHWHLSDDQGFRMESKTFPLLQEKGSDGLYYTQDQVRQVIEYARDRGIRVVPEFDMPCHTTSWFVGYPELASAKGPFQIARNWGVLDEAMDPTKESTYQFIDSFIGEMAPLFPDAYFHIGGDECDGKEWDANPQIQQFMHAHNLANNAALQAYFTSRVQKLVASHHKIMEGWDEVLQPETPKDVVIQSWRGLASLAQAARQGNRGMLSTPYYLNLNSPTSEYYLADPLGDDAAKLTPEQQARILGGEAAMWSEFATSENINSRIWPYLAAIAERFWSPQSVRDVDSMYRRLGIVSLKLEYYGLNSDANVNAMLERMSGQLNPAPLTVLAAVVQPPKGYKREHLSPADAFTPLNRMVDSTHPQSTQAREFNEIAKRIVAKTATPQDWQQAQQWLALWRDNDAQLQPILVKSSLTEELVPLSHNLHQVAVIGLEALSNLQNGRTMNKDARRHDLEFLQSVEKPQATVYDMVAPSVQLLVQANKTQ